MTYGTRQRMPMFHAIVASALGVGYAPWPATAGSLLGIIAWLPVYLSLPYSDVLWITLVAITAVTVIGCWSCTIAQYHWGDTPTHAAIDAVAGMWFTLLAIPPSAPWWQFPLAFFTYRLINHTKPLGVRDVRNLPVGIGIMADDVVAGIYSAIVIITINWLI